MNLHLNYEDGKQQAGDIRVGGVFEDSCTNSQCSERLHPFVPQCAFT